MDSICCSPPKASTRSAAVASPAPPARAFNTEGGIEVSTLPLEKIPLQNSKQCDCLSDGEESRYQIVWRFKRTA